MTNDIVTSQNKKGKVDHAPMEWSTHLPFVAVEPVGGQTTVCEFT